MTLLRILPVIEAIAIIGMAAIINRRCTREYLRQVPYIMAGLHVIVFYVSIMYAQDIFFGGPVFWNAWSGWLRVHVLSVLALELYWRLHTWTPPC